MWDKMMEGTAGVKEQNFKNEFKKNVHSCSVEGVFKVSYSAACHWAFSTESCTSRQGQIKACLSSDSSEIDKQKSRTLH